MIPKIFISFGMVCASAMLCAAEPIQIRAGEHENFTRVVLTLPEGASWSSTRRENVFSLTLAQHTSGFDTSSVFEIIPKTRLAAVTASQDNLILELNCECSVTPFLEQEIFLVLDVADAGVLPEEAITEIESYATTLPISGFEYGELLWQSKTDEDRVSGTKEPTRDHDEQNWTEERELQLRTGQAESILRAFSRASTQGLINIPDATQPAKSSETLASPISKTVVRKKPSGSYAEGQPREQSQIVVSDSFDRVLPTEIESTHNQCPDPRIVDIAQWGSGDFFASQIREKEIALFDATGRLDSDQILPVFQLYLYFGLGAEALGIASLDKSFAEAHPYLIDIANILEHGYARNPRALFNFYMCVSDLALWTVLSRENPSEISDPVANAALQALEKLPRHLRGFLGRELSQRFVTAKMISYAGIALRSGSRALLTDREPDSVPLALIKADAGNWDAAEEILNNVIADDSLESEEAVLRLVKDRLANRRKVEPDLVLALEAFAFENRSGPLAEGLYETLILALAASGQYKKSIDGLIDPLKRLSQDRLMELNNEILSILTLEESDVLFVEFALNELPRWQSLPNTDAATRAAQRLISLGFFTEAASFLGPSSSLTDDEKFGRARIMLNSGDARRAIGYLGDLSGEEASNLRARAYSLLGDHAQAYREYTATNNEDAANRAAWLSENWTELVTSDDPIYGPSVELSLEQLPTISASDDLLMQTESALSSSADTRKTLDALLSNSLAPEQ